VLSFLLFILMQIIVVVLVFGILILFLMACDFRCFIGFLCMKLEQLNSLQFIPRFTWQFDSVLFLLVWYSFFFNIFFLL